MAIYKISRESISDQVFDQMKELILEGEWKPGEKIPSETGFKFVMPVSSRASFKATWRRS